MSNTTAELVAACNALTASAFMASEVLRNLANTVVPEETRRYLHTMKRSLHLAKHAKSWRVRKKHIKQLGLVWVLMGGANADH